MVEETEYDDIVQCDHSYDRWAGERMEPNNKIVVISKKEPQKIVWKNEHLQKSHIHRCAICENSKVFAENIKIYIINGHIL